MSEASDETANKDLNVAEALRIGRILDRTAQANDYNALCAVLSELPGRERA